MKILVTALLFTSLFAAFEGARQQDDTRRGTIHGMVYDQTGKPWAGVGLVLEPVGDYDYVLPRTKSDENGFYRFSEVDIGFWRVFVEDKVAGYPETTGGMSWFLYGALPPPVKITDGSWDAEVNVKAQPRPGLLTVSFTDRQIKALKGEVELRVTRRRRMQFGYYDAEFSSGETLEIPPDVDVWLRMKFNGFRHFKREKPIHLSPGETMNI